MRFRRRRREEPSYPPYVVTEAERERWVVAEGLALQMFGDASPYDVWHATRAIYRSETPARASDDEGQPRG